MKGGKIYKKNLFPFLPVLPCRFGEIKFKRYLMVVKSRTNLIPFPPVFLTALKMGKYNLKSIGGRGGGEEKN